MWVFSDSLLISHKILTSPRFSIAEMGMKTLRRTPHFKLHIFMRARKNTSYIFVISFLFLNDNVTKHTDHSLGRRVQITTPMFGSIGLMHNLNIFALLIFNLKLRLQK